ncbi:hypothetical protein EDD11_004955 [Mortierella claussenii]|nr:hypothetical protein EDD11_004955 [Mortierella claussenii]
MGYEYILIAVAILVPLGLLGVFKSDHLGAAHAVDKKASLPGAFMDPSTSKSKKKKPKKKSVGAKGSSTACSVHNSGDQGQESDESEEVQPAVQPPIKSAHVSVTAAKKGNGKKTSSATHAPASAQGNNTSHQSSAVTTSTSSHSIDSGKSSKNKDQAPTSSTLSNTSNSNSSSSSTTHTTNVSKTVKPASVESWKKQKQEQQKELLAKQQETLQFASAAARNASSSTDSSLHIASIPGPGAMGNKKKSNRGHAGSGLSHAEFPTLSRPAPAPAPVPKQAKPPKQKKEAVKAPEPVVIQAQEESEEEEEEKEEESEEEEGSVEEYDAKVSQEEQATQAEKEDEWTTVSSTQSRSGGIDFSKPMDPWVAQQQRQKLELIAAADPHGEQTEKFARVLSIKPTVKEERIREAIPDGFTTQKSRSGGSSGGSSQHQSAELSKKQRENLAKAAKKKEEKAAMDAVQEQRRLEHLRQVKAEKMKEFYRAQTRKQTPVESRWDAPKNTAPSSSNSGGGMSSQVNNKGQLAWD